jgi:parallel beta-helix repeat protein
MSLIGRGAVAVTGCGALMLGMITAGAAPASAAALPCGYTATSSIKLTANINCTTDTADNGINIAASDITINLNGHSILGPGANNADTVGVADNPSGSPTFYNNVTIENGTISNFAGDIVLEGNPGGSDLTGAVVEKITTTNNELGNGEAVFGGGLSGASIHNLSVSDPYYGVQLVESQASKVYDNHVQSAGYGLTDDSGSGNTWSGNTVANVNFAGISTEDSTATVIKANTLAGGRAGTGVYDFASSGTSITDNTMTNDIGAGIGSEESSDATINSNKGSTIAFGIYTTNSVDFTLTGNQFNDSQYGIETDCPVGELLKNNTTNDNSEVGVYVYTGAGQCSNSTTYSATLDDNTANDNRFGLYSQVVTSGSGNEATGNTIINCYQVSCTSGAAPKGTTVPAPPHTLPRTFSSPPSSFRYGWPTG